jgi:hypothetical protein
MDEVFNMVSFFTLLRAMKRVLLGRGKPGRFEVTSKRGDGDRDFGPVLPHLLLLGFSVLGISWSLMGLGFGIDDDVRGAAVGIFWTLYNAALMLAALKLGSRPAEKRGASRFRANFAVEARDAADHGTLGVTADISEQGCSLLWPTRLDVGRRLPLRVHFGPKSADWTGEVVSDLGQQQDGWHRYGVRFADLGPAGVDLINDMVFSIVVPDFFIRLNEPAWHVRLWRRVTQSLAARRQRRASRQFVRVPVRVQYAGGTFVTTVRDLSASGLSIQSPQPVPSGAALTVTMYVPARTWRGTAVVARSEARPSRPGFDTWILGLRFEREQSAADVEPFRKWDAA